MENNSWKYLVRELILYYPSLHIVKSVGTNKTSFYNWLSGKSYPRFEKFKKRLITLAKTIDSPEKLVDNSKRKEQKIDKLVKRPIFHLTKGKIIINTIPIILKEMKVREKSSADKWYVKEVYKEYIVIKYFDNRGKWKEINLPLKLVWSEELAKITGFWFGDGTTEVPTNMRFRPYLSFSNAEISVLKFIKEYFSKLEQDNVLDEEIIAGKMVNAEKLKSFEQQINSIFGKKVSIRKHEKWNSVGVYFHVRNAPLAYVFHVLKENINFLLFNFSNEVKASFLGGYFTAEGNVSKINQWFSFSETKVERKKLIIRLLKELNFGNSQFPPRNSGKEQIRIAYREEIRKHDFELFRTIILPFIFSEEKVNETKEMLEGYNLREIDLIYLFYLYLHPNYTTNEIAKSFCKDKDYVNRVFRRLERLVERNRKKRINPLKLKLTESGKEVLSQNLTKIKEILKETKRVSHTGRGYKGAFYIFHPNRKCIVSAIREMIEYFNL